MGEEPTLQIEIAAAPFPLASRRPASVSAVSPDWDTGMHKVPGSTTGSRYRYSEPRSTSPRRRKCFEEDLAGLGENPSRKRVQDRTRLLVDFLEHEVAVAALLRHDGRPVDVDRRAPFHVPGEIGPPHPPRPGPDHP